MDSPEASYNQWSGTVGNLRLGLELFNTGSGQMSPCLVGFNTLGIRLKH